MSSDPHSEPEQLLAFADGNEGDVSPLIARHIRSCEQCREAVAALRRGLGILSVGSVPPHGLAQAARAKRWAARDRVPEPMDEEDDQLEVGGRELPEADSRAKEGPEGSRDLSE